MQQYPSNPFQHLLQPLINRIQQLQHKNSYLYQQFNQIITQVPNYQNHSKLPAKRQSLPSLHSNPRKQKIQPKTNKAIKNQTNQDIKSNTIQNQSKVQTQSINSSKVEQRKSNSNLVNSKLTNQPKKQERERIISSKGNTDKKIPNKDLKKDEKKITNVSTTPVINKKTAINDLKNQEQKSQVIVEVLDLVQQATQKEQKGQGKSPDKNILVDDKKSTQNKQENLIQQKTTQLQPQKKVQVPQQEHPVKVPPKGKNTSTLPNKTTNHTSKTNIEPRASIGDNKITSSKKISEGEGQLNKIASKNNIKTPSKADIHPKSTTKGLKQNNKGASNVKELIKKQQTKNNTVVENQKVQIQILKVDKAEEGEQTDLLCNQVLEFKKQNLT